MIEMPSAAPTTTTKRPPNGRIAPKPLKAPATAPADQIDGPELPPPPELAPLASRASRAGHLVFRVLNPRTTVPLIRAGLGPWLGSPIGGWLLVIRVRGRKTGLMHAIPLSYRIDEGCAWVMAGFGPGTQWYRNVLVDPHVELWLPGRMPIRAIAEEVRNREVRARIVPRLVRATGVPGYMTGVDPYRAPEERILEVTAWVPLIRIRPEDEGEPLLAGPDDPGGLGWVWRQVVALTLTIWAMRRLRRLVGRVVSSLPRPGR